MDSFVCKVKTWQDEKKDKSHPFFPQQKMLEYARTLRICFSSSCQIFTLHTKKSIGILFCRDEVALQNTRRKTIISLVSCSFASNFLRDRAKFYEIPVFRTYLSSIVSKLEWH